VGNFYVHFSVKCPDQKKVCAVLQRAKRSAFVTPPSKGYVVVFEKESEGQDPAAIEKVGVLLSRGTKAPVLTVLNNDDDLLCYWLFENGRRLDFYASDPLLLYDDEDLEESSFPLGDPGDPERLCAVLSVPKSVKKVQAVLEDTEGLAVMQHSALMRALGLPSWSAMPGAFRGMEEGKLPARLSKKLVRVGARRKET
jgi:hypothetical protein